MYINIILWKCLFLQLAVDHLRNKLVVCKHNFPKSCLFFKHFMMQLFYICSKWKCIKHNYTSTMTRKKTMSQKSFQWYTRVHKVSIFLKQQDNNISQPQVFKQTSQRVSDWNFKFSRHNGSSCIIIARDSNMQYPRHETLKQTFSMTQRPHSLINLSFNFPFLQALFKLLSLWFSCIGGPIIGESFFPFLSSAKGLW